MGPETATSIEKEWLREAFSGTDAVTVTGCPGAGARGAATAACEPTTATPSTSDILIRNLEVRGTAVLLLASGVLWRDGGGPEKSGRISRPESPPGAGPRDAPAATGESGEDRGSLIGYAGSVQGLIGSPPGTGGIPPPPGYAARMAEETGRWVRIPCDLRDDLAEAGRQVPHPAVISVLELYDRARPEDWIAQLVAVNRELSDELRRVQGLSAAESPRRQSA